MTSLKVCRRICEEFVRFSVARVGDSAAKLPTMPLFRALPGRSAGRYRIEEVTQPNWWQLPRAKRAGLLGSTSGQAAIKALETTKPFADVVGRSVVCPGTSSTYTAPDIAANILVSYLFACGAGRWKPAVFQTVWGDCVSFFDPTERKLTYFMYAPIYGMSGIARRLTLEDDFVIRRLPASEVARLASLDPSIAGTSVGHRRTQWTSLFFVGRCELDKRIAGPIPASEGDAPFTALDVLPPEKPYNEWFTRLIEELAILRALLGHETVVPCYALIREGSPRDPGGGALPPELPWRVRSETIVHPGRSGGDVRAYVRRRQRFRELRGSAGWDTVRASMRRFALAWENPFPADTLADIVAALEHLLVGRDNREVGYKLRLRTAHLLESSVSERIRVMRNVRDAYEYRSGVVHGSYVPDHLSEVLVAMRKKGGKKGTSALRKVREIRELTEAVSSYYQRAVGQLIDRGELEVDWSQYAL